MHDFPQLVTNPADFDREILKRVIFEPPIDKELYRQVDFYYFAVFHKEVNFPGEKYNELIKAQFDHPFISEALLTSPPGFQHKFDGGDEEIAVDTWYFKNDPVGDEKPLMVVVVIARVDPKLTLATEMIL